MSSKTTPWTELVHCLWTCTNRRHCLIHWICSLYFLMRKGLCLVKEQKMQKIQKVSLLNSLWKFTLATINVTTTAAAKVKIVNWMRMVQMIEVVSICLCQQGLEGKECSCRMRDCLQSRWRHVYPNGTKKADFKSLCASVCKETLKMGFRIW